MSKNVIDYNNLYRDVREKGQYSIREISVITGVSKSVVGEVLNINAKSLSLENIIKFSVWLDKPVDRYIRKKYKEAVKSIQKATINQMDFD